MNWLLLGIISILIIGDDGVKSILMKRKMVPKVQEREASRMTSFIMLF